MEDAVRLGDSLVKHSLKYCTLGLAASGVEAEGRSCRAARPIRRLRSPPWGWADPARSSSGVMSGLRRAR